MTFTFLSSLLLRLHRVPAPPSALPFRERAAARALACFGGALLLDLPELVNVAGLSISMEPRLVLHRVSPGAASLVHATDLHSLPGEPPRLLRDGWLLESRDIESEPLFGRTVCLGGYRLEEAIYLVGLDYPDGANVARWVPHWGEGDLEQALVTPDHSPLIADFDAHYEWAREAARFALVLGLHLDAEGSPVVTTEEHGPHPGQQRRGAGQSVRDKRQADWIVRRVHLSKLFTPRAGDTPPGDGALDTAHRLGQMTAVHGHLKRQPYGPGAALRRWIWVDGYEARRWVAPKPLRVDVLP